MIVGKHMRTTSIKVTNTMLSIALAMGLMPACAYASADSASSASIPASTCLIVKTPRAADIADEPALARLDDAYLLSFGSVSEAQAAFSRLKDAGVTVEFDRVTVAAQPNSHNRHLSGEGPAYAPGNDPFTLAASDIASFEQPDIRQVNADADESPEAISHAVETSHPMKHDGGALPLFQAGFDESDEQPDIDGISASSGSEPKLDSSEPDSSKQDEEEQAPAEPFDTPDEELANIEENPSLNEEGIPSAAEPETACDGSSSTSSSEEATEYPDQPDADGEPVSSDPRDPGIADSPSDAQTPYKQTPHTIAIIDSGAAQDELITEAIDLTGLGAQDAFGQASAVMSAIREVSPDTRVISIRVLGDDGLGTVAAAYAGIKVAIAHKPDIINIALSAEAAESAASASPDPAHRICVSSSSNTAQKSSRRKKPGLPSFQPLVTTPPMQPDTPPPMCPVP